MERLLHSPGTSVRESAQDVRMAAPRRLYFGMRLCLCVAIVAIATCALAQVPGRPANPPSELSPQAEVTTISVKGEQYWTLVTEVGGDLRACLAAICYRVDTGTSPAGLIPLSLKVANPLALGLGFGSVWVTVRKSEVKGHKWLDPDTFGPLYRLDPKTNEEVATIPASGFWILIADGSVWVFDGSLLYRVDPKSNHVRGKIPLEQNRKSEVAIGFKGVPLPEPYIAAAMGSVWVLYTDGTLSRIDPGTNQLLAKIRVGPPHRGGVFSYDSYSGLAVDEGSAWITESKEESNLIRVDLKTNRVVATIPVGYRAQNPVVGGGFIWVSTYYSDKVGHFVVKIDPRTNQVLGSMLLRGTQPYLSAQEHGILAWGEELRRWGSPRYTYIWKIPY